MSQIEPASDQRPDTTVLRRALGCFVTGVTVVTTCGADRRPHGFTANSFTSVSLDPPLVLVCVGHAVESLEAYRECEGFAINMLAHSQQATANMFATEFPDRFAGVRWREGSHGSPILEGCVASLECASWQRIEAGDHMILIGRVLASEHSTDHPLAFCRGRYLSLQLERDVHMHEDRCTVRPVLQGRSEQVC